MLNLDKACSAFWLERAALCQSLAEFFFEKQNHFKQLNRWLFSSQY